MFLATDVEIELYANDACLSFQHNDADYVNIVFINYVIKEYTNIYGLTSFL